MKTFVFLTIKITCLLIFISGTNSCGKVTSQVSGIREVENKSHLNKQAPAECIDTFRSFFSLVQTPEQNIIADENSQKRWLSVRLQKALSHHLKKEMFQKHPEHPDYPNNYSFVGVWNFPTTFSIIGSRHYDYRNDDNPADNRAVIDVLYEWDTYSDGINNQYPGDKSLRSFIFVFEDGSWKLDDIYTFTDESASPGSLSNFWGKE